MHFDCNYNNTCISAVCRMKHLSSWYDQTFRAMHIVFWQMLLREYLENWVLQTISLEEELSLFIVIIV